jgi:hypothetical protein
MKPLKKRIQIALGGKKRKSRGSLSSSKNNPKKYSGSKDYASRTPTPKDSTSKDSVIIEQPSGTGIALMDTVIRIYYADLNDSLVNKYKTIIKSFVSRTGTNHISEILLTDYFSEEGFTDISIKSDIGKYLMDIGVSKHRLFWSKNKRLKIKEGVRRPKKLIYLEIRFH